MKKSLIITGLLLSLAIFTTNSCFAAPHGPAGPHGGGHKPPMHHGQAIHPPMHHVPLYRPPVHHGHHYHHVRHSRYYNPYYYGYNSGLNLIFSNGRLIHPMHPGHIGAVFHLSI